MTKAGRFRFTYIIGLGKTITQANAATVNSGGNIISRNIFFTFIISYSLNFNLDIVGWARSFDLVIYIAETVPTTWEEY